MANEVRELSTDQLASVSGGATGGISQLIAVTMAKADNANQEAMAGALAGALGGAATKRPHKIG
jgi:bacteriocin-like protein